MHRGKVIAAAAVAAVVLLLLLWGSSSGTPVLSAPSGEAGTREPRPPTTLPAGDQVPTTSGPADLGPGINAIDWLMVFFALVVLVIAIRVIQWLLNRDWEQSDAPAEDELSDDLDLLLEATSEEARARALTEGEPRNVVVRCWVALEDAAAASGLARDPSETAAEFTRRFLGSWDVDVDLTQELAELYREARFSRHPVSRETGDRAVAVVSSIHDQLRASNARRAEQAEAEETQAEGTTSATPPLQQPSPPRSPRHGGDQ